MRSRIGRARGIGQMADRRFHRCAGSVRHFDNLLDQPTVLIQPKPLVLHHDSVESHADAARNLTEGVRLVEQKVTGAATSLSAKPIPAQYVTFSGLALRGWARKPPLKPTMIGDRALFDGLEHACQRQVSGFAVVNGVAAPQSVGEQLGHGD